MDQLHQLELELGVIPGMLVVLHSLCSEVKQRLHCFAGYHVQFLILIISSISPSYVSWVKKGVIISTRRSKIIRQSTLSDGARSVSGKDVLEIL